MASLFIKDGATAASVTRLADRLGKTKTDVVRQAIDALEAILDREAPKLSARERLEKFYREHPLPPPTGLKADKAFFDELSGDL